MEEFDKLRELLLANFGERIVCILLHGSSVFNPQAFPHDLDLVIVLSDCQNEDISVLRGATKTARLNHQQIQLHLLYRGEIPINADHFSLNTCGAFFVWHLRHAHVLYGRNVFDSVDGPSDYQLQISLTQKIQQYTFHLRNLNFHLDKVGQVDLVLARKRSITVLKDILMSLGTLIQNEAEIVKEALQRYPDFSPEDRQLLLSLPAGWLPPQTEEEQKTFLFHCLQIHERAYAIMRRQLSAKVRCQFLK